MGNTLNALYEICETVSAELEDANEKIRAAGGKLSAGDVDYIDKLTHTLKSVKTTVAMMEAEDGGYSRRGMSMNGYAYADGQDGGMSGRSRRGGNSYEDGNSYRGRGYSMRRDSMGRYSRDAGKDEFTRHLQELVDMAPNDRMRQQVEKIVREMDQN